MGEEKHGFLTSLPGILSGLAALITAGVGAYALIGKSREAPPPVSQPSPDAALVTPDKADVPPVQPTPTSTPTASAAVDGRYTSTAVVDDPDGYVNVRAGPSTQSAIVATVRLNETIRTYPQQQTWWKVRTRAGTEGYIHSSRIRIVGG